MRARSQCLEIDHPLCLATPHRRFTWIHEYKVIARIQPVRKHKPNGLSLVLLLVRPRK